MQELYALILGKELFFVLLLVIVVAVLLISAIVNLFLSNRIEIGPKRAVVFKNIWSGEAIAFLPGSYNINPIVYKLIDVDITLENEPSDPKQIETMSADGMKTSLDYVIVTQKIPANKESIIKAATEIDYKNREKLINIKIQAYAQNEMVRILVQDIIDETKKKDSILQQIEDGINTSLETLLNDWGIEVKIETTNLILPEKIDEVAEESATAVKEGTRIKDKAIAAGVDPTVMAIIDGIYDVVRTMKGGK